MLKLIAATRYMFFHNGRRSRLSFSESEFIALNISTVTRIERLIVVARRDISLVNMLHPISGNCDAHWWKCLYNKNVRIGFHNALTSTHELVKRYLWTSRIENKPPRVTEDGRTSDVHADDHVAEEQPFADEWLAAVSW